MPRRKPNLEKQQQKKIQDSLESLLDDGHHFELDHLKADDMPPMKSIPALDFTKLQLLTMADAKDYLDQMVDFYYGEELESNTDHLRKKKKIDNMHLSSILLQMKTTQHAIMKVMEEIEMGNMQPRMLEVLGQLQSQLVGYSKEYQSFIKSMEESYKILRVESEQKLMAGAARVTESEDGSLEVDTSSLKKGEDGTIKVRGTKALMEGIHNETQEIQDVDVVEVPVVSRVDARKKAQEENEKRIDNKETEEKFDLDDDLFR